MSRCLFDTVEGKHTSIGANYRSQLKFRGKSRIYLLNTYYTINHTLFVENYTYILHWEGDFVEINVTSQCSWKISSSNMPESVLNGLLMSVFMM